VCVLLTFYFTGRKTADGVWQRPGWLQGLVPIGKMVLTITFGFLFAVVLSTSLILLTERIDFYFTLIRQLLS
jgi:hypothetical protein